MGTGKHILTEQRLECRKDVVGTHVHSFIGDGGPPCEFPFHSLFLQDVLMSNENRTLVAKSSDDEKTSKLMCRQTVMLLLKSPLYFLFLKLIGTCLFSIDLQSIMFRLVPKVNVFTFSGVCSKTTHVLMGLLPFFFFNKKT